MPKQSPSYLNLSCRTNQTVRVASDACVCRCHHIHLALSPLPSPRSDLLRTNPAHRVDICESPHRRLVENEMSMEQTWIQFFRCCVRMLCKLKNKYYNAIHQDICHHCRIYSTPSLQRSHFMRIIAMSQHTWPIWNAWSTSDPNIQIACHQRKLSEMPWQCHGNTTSHHF